MKYSDLTMYSSATSLPQSQEFFLNGSSTKTDIRTRAELLEVVEAGDIPIETPSVDITSLQPTGTASDIFYYHMNHLGSTAFVTDQNQNVTQGFLYAPFGEIISEYQGIAPNSALPKYTFNAKELDEETGMYYYEARYYQPPTFTSRDPHFERYFWHSPYAYCGNNPLNKVDPTGMDEYEFDKNGKLLNTIENKNADILRIVKADRKGNVKHDKNGNTKTIAEKSFNYASIANVDNVILSDVNTNEPYNATQIEVKNENDREGMFRFLADNTSVEWSTMVGATASNKTYIGVISTSRERDVERSGQSLVKMHTQFCDFINIWEHSHPINSMGVPSGYSHMSGREPYESGDHAVAIRWGDLIHSMRVYESGTNNVYEYDKNGYRLVNNP